MVDNDNHEALPWRKAFDPKSLIGWVIGKRYEVVRYLKSGGFAEVYEGVDVELAEHRVVLKFLKQYQTRDRFEKEARILCKLDHPNICRIIGYLPVEGALVMPFISGSDCQSILDETETFNEKLILSIASSVTSAVAYAHEQRVAHRDIKPSNIMLDRHDHVYLIDFGIAKELDATQLTKTGRPPLTPQIAAPERLKGEQYDPFLSDIYEIGATLLLLSTRCSPTDYFMPHRSRSSARAFGPRLSSRMTQVLEKATQRDPQQRYRSARQLAADLRGVTSVYSRSRLAYYIGAGLATIAVISIGLCSIPDARQWISERVPSLRSLEHDSVASAVDSNSVLSDSEDTASQINVPTAVESRKLNGTEEHSKQGEQKQQKYILSVSVEPKIGTALYIDGERRSAGRDIEVSPGMHSITLINPDFPVFTDSLDVRVDRYEPYDLFDEYGGVKKLTLCVGLRPALADANIEMELNGKIRRLVGIPAYPEVLAGPWIAKFRIADASGQHFSTDSFVVCPGTIHTTFVSSGPHEIDLTSTVCEGRPMIDVLLYWSAHKE